MFASGITRLLMTTLSIIMIPEFSLTEGPDELANTLVLQKSELSKRRPESAIFAIHTLKLLPFSSSSSS